MAATLVDVVDFFPVTFLYGVSKVPVFRAGALVLHFAACLLCRGDDRHSVVLFAVPEGGAHAAHEHKQVKNMRLNPPPPDHSWWARFNAAFNRYFQHGARLLRTLGAPCI